MNVLTSPLFPVLSETGEFKRVSTLDVWVGDVGGLQLRANSPFQHLSCIQLLANLTATMAEDLTEEGETPSFEDLDPEYISLWVEENALLFEVFSDKGPRFMQVPFDPGMGAEPRGDVHKLFLPDIPGDSGQQFGRNPALQESCYCPECATLDLFCFHQHTPGAGKPSHGPHLNGLNTLLSGGDVRETVLRNTVFFSEDSEDWFTPAAQLVYGNPVSKNFPWGDPELVELLKKGSRLVSNDPRVNRRSYRFWMPRQVWMTLSELPEERRCITCGSLSRLSVETIQEGAGKKKFDKNLETKCYGSLSLDTDPLSEFKPSRTVLIDQKPHVKPYRATVASDLLSISERFFQGGEGCKVAPVVAAHLDSMGRRSDISLWVFSVTVSTKGFDQSVQASIPINRTQEDMAGLLKEMSQFAEDMKASLWKALWSFFKPSKKNSSPRIGLALASFDLFVGRFTEYLSNQGDPLKEWEKDLRGEATRLYNEATQDDLMGVRGDPPQTKMLLYSIGHKILHQSNKE